MKALASTAGPARITSAKLVGYALVIPLGLAMLLFLPAGSWDWELGWLFWAVYLVAGILAAVFLWCVNPEIYVARSRFQKGTKGWDLILVSLLLLAMLACFPVAALDASRFHWSSMPGPVIAGGYALLLFGIALMTWAEAVNPFFEPGVRIQSNRGHHLIDTGPYAIVRHPGYVAGLALLAAIPLALGSQWALVPAAVGAAILVLRTRWEDQMLQAELTGYRQYAGRVRFRLLPGVW